MAQNKKDNDPNSKTVARNRKARFNYFIEDTLEAGIVLMGTEVKSLRGGQASINESYADVKEGALYLLNAYIPEYVKAHVKLQHEVRRPRKLLLHKNQLKKLMGAVQRKGTTIVPLVIFFNRRGIAKVLLGIATGKKQYDKRATEKDRDWSREKSRIMREKGREE
ncbi:MAG: SsrA-binding protein SmpB [Alphaproteobacteria bacterium]|nr:SsrA-binding protein SmpB [Alphaproteobacteria bacterium]MCK5556573.1 SsrA-binding protein SmpB [Alphaproteobacteria bacterium]